MSPVALTNQEKMLQKKKIMDACEQLVFKHGISKVNAADIIKESKISRGTFYKHFRNKDECIAVTVFNLHLIYMQDLQLQFKEIMGLDFPVLLKSTIKEILHSYQLLTLFDDYNDIDSLMQHLPKEDIENHLKQEEMLITNLLFDLGIDSKIVVPEVVHNLFFIISQVNANRVHQLESQEETIDVLIDTLVRYVLQGVNNPK